MPVFRPGQPNIPARRADLARLGAGDQYDPLGGTPRSARRCFGGRKRGLFGHQWPGDHDAPTFAARYRRLATP